MKIIGIVGGMGPAAGADMLLKITSATAAKQDQAHVPVLLFSNTAIPDRTAAILTEGADPRPELLRSAKLLADAGAQLLVIACNTAHHYYNDIAANIDIPILHMPRETAAYVSASRIPKVALLSTSGTVASGVYAKAFASIAPEVELLIPDEQGQRALMGLIYDGVKKGCMDYPPDAVLQAMQTLKDRGAGAFILGCTELPLAAEAGMLPWDSSELIDPTYIVARAAVLAVGATCV